MSRICITSILYLSQLYSHYHHTYFQPSSTSPTSSSEDISPIPSTHAALPLHQICHSYLTIVLSCHPDPTSMRSSFWSPLPLPSIPMHCPCTSSTSHFVNKPIIILSSIWSST